MVENRNGEWKSMHCYTVTGEGHGEKRYNGVSLSDSSMKVMSQEITVIVTFRVAGAWRRGGQGGGGP